MLLPSASMAAAASMSSVRVYGLHPSGGPHLGATDVTVFGTGFAIAENDASLSRAPLR